MKLEDLYLINKEEWLDVIKDKCKKKAKTDFWLGLVYLLFMILLSLTYFLNLFNRCSGVARPSMVLKKL